VIFVSKLGKPKYFNALDRTEIKDDNIAKYIHIDLGNKDSIDNAVAQLPDRIDSIFSVAGVAGEIYRGSRFTPTQVVTINFIGARRLIESLIPRMPAGGSIVMCSSVAGSAWPMHVNVYRPFAEIDDWDEAIKYFEDRLDDPEFMGPPELANKAYVVSKETMIIYAKYRSWALSEKHIRINTISPAAIKSPMHDDFNELTGMERGTPLPGSPANIESEPVQQAAVMLFMNSDMADYVSGQDLQVDYALMGGIMTGVGSMPGSIVKVK